MKPDKVTVFDLFQVQRRYLVPLYQRPYVWNQEDHWEPLWLDIERKADELLDQGRQARPHFLGAVVLNQTARRTREVDGSEIIDGQQRLTTLQLFLAAFRDFVEAAKDDRLARELRRLTVNDRIVDNPSHRFKVWPTRADQDVFVKVMEAGSRALVEAAFVRSEGGKIRSTLPALARAYVFFHEQIEEYVRGGSAGGPAHDDRRLNALYEAVERQLQIVAIDLEGTDDPQVIFETLNARGVPLLPSDLIRNFLLHKAQAKNEDLEQLYDRWWREFDERRAEDPTAEDQFFWKKLERQGRLERPRIDLFFFHYLQYRTKRETNISHIFREFTDWWERREDASVSSGLEDIRRHGDLFATFFLPEPDTRTGQFLGRLRLLDTSTVYPLMLQLFGPDGEGLTSDERDGILLDLESYLIRRLVCRLTTKKYNKFFFSLLRAVAESGEPSRALVRERLLSSTEETTRWPADDEFRKAWLQAPAYKNIRRDRIQMILAAIENSLYGDRQERLAAPRKLTIEHVLPQKWRPSWPAPTTIAGEPLTLSETPEDQRERLLHSFGNLTLLTAVLNTETSNGPYDAKRGAISRQSVLLLNRCLLDARSWDEATILKRGNDLFSVACGLWPHPGGHSIAASPVIESELRSPEAPLENVEVRPQAGVAEGYGIYGLLAELVRRAGRPMTADVLAAQLRQHQPDYGRPEGRVRQFFFEVRNRERDGLSPYGGDIVGIGPKDSSGASGALTVRDGHGGPRPF